MYVCFAVPAAFQALHTQLTFSLPQFPIKRPPRVISKGFYQKSENPKIPNYISTPDPLLKQPLVIP